MVRAEAQAAGVGGAAPAPSQRGQVVYFPMDGFRFYFLFACALWVGVVSFGLFVEKNNASLW